MAEQSPTPIKSADSARIVMLETVSHAQTTSDGRMDVGVLIRFMDICTCSSAEAFTGVNCVTAAVGDVSIGYFPCVGDIVEFVAMPVLTGRTSLEVRGEKVPSYLG